MTTDPSDARTLPSEPGPPPPPRPQRRGCGCLLVLLLLLLGASLLVNFALLGREVVRETAPDLRGRDLREETIEGRAAEPSKVALIEISGVIQESLPSVGRGVPASAIRREIERATDDPDVKAILLRLETPGGEVGASDMIYETVRRAAETKKVLAWFGSIATSGGYYVASAADEIMSTPLSATGSIGVILVLLNYRDLLDKVGVEPLLFTSGAYKDLYSGLRDAPLSDEERGMIQERIDEAHGRFVSVVARGRAITEETLRTRIADGRIFTGEQARGLQLVDRIGYFEDALERARELGGSPGARLIRYRKPFSIRDMLSARSDPPSLRVEFGQPGIRVAPGVMYFLPHTMIAVGPE